MKSEESERLDRLERAVMEIAAENDATGPIPEEHVEKIRVKCPNVYKLMEAYGWV